MQAGNSEDHRLGGNQVTEQRDTMNVGRIRDNGYRWFVISAF